MLKASKQGTFGLETLLREQFQFSLKQAVNSWPTPTKRPRS